MTLRGMAARAVRPGYIIRDVLGGAVPLITVSGIGESRVYDESFVDRASLNDLHRTYTRTVQVEINQARRPANRIRPMTYQSFLTLARRSRYLGLIEVVGSEPAQADLVTVRDGVVVPSTRTIVALTEEGRSADEEIWGNIGGAYARFLQGKLETVR